MWRGERCHQWPPAQTSQTQESSAAQHRAPLPSLPSLSPGCSSRLLESPWLSACFEDTAAASSGWRPAPNEVRAAEEGQGTCPLLQASVLASFWSLQFASQRKFGSGPSLRSLQGRRFGGTQAQGRGAQQRAHGLGKPMEATGTCRVHGGSVHICPPAPILPEPAVHPVLPRCPALPLFPPAKGESRELLAVRLGSASVCGQSRGRPHLRGTEELLGWGDRSKALKRALQHQQPPAASLLCPGQEQFWACAHLHPFLTGLGSHSHQSSEVQGEGAASRQGAPLWCPRHWNPPTLALHSPRAQAAPSLHVSQTAERGERVLGRDPHALCAKAVGP